MSKTKNRMLSRREFLAASGAAGPLGLSAWDPLGLLVSSLVGGFISRAQAAEGVAVPRKYVNLALVGAPTRWVFDLPVTPMAGQVFSPNPHVITRFDLDAATNTYRNASYQTVDITSAGVTYRMPYLWGQTIPTADGGERPMAVLLENMLMCRGINSGFDGHEGNTVRQTRPDPNNDSLGGSLANGSHRPIPAVALTNAGATADPSQGYYSKRGVGQVTVNPHDANPLSSIINAFRRDAGQPGMADLLTRKQALQPVIDTALQALGNYSRTGNPGAQALYANAGAAESLLARSFGDLGARWTGLVGKYRALVRRSMGPMPGISDRVIATPAFSDGQLKYSKNAGVGIGLKGAFATDLRGVINDSSGPNSVAECMAIAEFLLTADIGMGPESLASTITMASRRFRINMTDAYDYDQHFTGEISALLVTSYIFRSVAACLYELSGALKRHGSFDSTVIQLSSEFGRTPNNNGVTGTDHGWNSQNLTLYSGLIKRPLIMGNIRANPGGSLPGTWGLAAPVDLEGGDTDLNLGHLTTTVATVLGVKSPSPNFQSVVSVGPTGVTNNIGDPRNV